MAKKILTTSELDSGMSLEEQFESLKLFIKNQSLANESGWIASKDVPDYLGISRRTWQRYRNERLIPFSQIGRKIWVKKADIDKFLEKGTIGRSINKNVEN
ncbi:helix-turn-helix domain-containing protein [Butyricimonas virosa]|uniref:helix-turn-helix domain-containing protein n=1 Tax=Butyricimonas virosa TaxID=544645 RepID=UPI00242D2848|nr:helix-turn-helix domain-containing protein [Butyricimonas virosa]